MAKIGRTFKLQTFSEKIASYPESFILQNNVKSCLYPPSLKREYERRVTTQQRYSLQPSLGQKPKRVAV